MRYDSYTDKYLDILNRLKDELDQRSDQPLDKLIDFIYEKTFVSPARSDLLFAIGLVKAPEKILIEKRSHPKRTASLILKVHDLVRYEFIWADIPGKDKIDDQKAREALLSKADTGKLKVPGVIRAAKKIIKTCKVERVK